MRRCDEPGWTLEVRDDPSGRRGIWTRSSSPDRLEICAGREGDDAYLDVRVGQLVTPRLLAALRDVLAHGKDPGIEYEVLTSASERTE